MCILIWRGCFCVIDEVLDSNQLVIGAQLLNNVFIRPCDVFNGSPLQSKYVSSALMSLLWASPGKMAHLILWHYCAICLVYTELASQKTNAQKSLQIVIGVIMLFSMCPMKRTCIHVFVLFCLVNFFFSVFVTDYSSGLPTCHLATSFNNQQKLLAGRKQQPCTKQSD